MKHPNPQSHIQCLTCIRIQILWGLTEVRDTWRYIQRVKTQANKVWTTQSKLNKKCQRHFFDPLSLTITFLDQERGHIDCGLKAEMILQQYQVEPRVHVWDQMLKKYSITCLNLYKTLDLLKFPLIPRRWSLLQTWQALVFEALCWNLLYIQEKTCNWWCLNQFSASLRLN